MLAELAGEIARILSESGRCIAVAESCTGGVISSALTSVDGASNWMRAGIVAYTKTSKIGLLGLKEDDISDGLVSEKCALAMTRGTVEQTACDYALSTTGVCASESEGILPCSAWIGIKTPLSYYAFLVQSEDQGRIKNRELVSKQAMQLFLDVLRKERA